MARFGGKEITQSEWETLASSYDYNSLEYMKLINEYSADSLRLAAEARYGKDWGQHLVMHTDHGPALTLILHSMGIKRKATKLEETDSLSGRVTVEATGTTGMETIEKAKPLWGKIEIPTSGGGSGDGGKVDLTPVLAETSKILSAISDLTDEQTSRAKLAQLRTVAAQAEKDAKLVTAGGRPVQKLKEIIKLLTDAAK